MKTYTLIVVDHLNPQTKNQITEFRQGVPDINGKVRTPEEEAKRLEKYCSDGDIKRWILVFMENELIGMAAVFKRIIHYHDSYVSLGGIGKLRVREDWRRKGIANAIMKESVKQLSILNCDVAFISTNLKSFLVRFYEKYGFIPLNKSYIYTGYSGKKYREQNGMLIPIKSKQVFQTILNSLEPLDIGQGNW